MKPTNFDIPITWQDADSAPSGEVTSFLRHENRVLRARLKEKDRRAFDESDGETKDAGHREKQARLQRQLKAERARGNRLRDQLDAERNRIRELRVTLEEGHQLRLGLNDRLQLLSSGRKKQVEHMRAADQVVDERFEAVQSELCSLHDDVLRLHRKLTRETDNEPPRSRVRQQASQLGRRLTGRRTNGRSTNSADVLGADGEPAGGADG